MRITSDYHTHTFYSDGKGTMEQNIQAAIAAGLSTVGISDHGYAHLGFGIKYDKIQYMREELDQLKEKYRKEKIEILLGIECNILDDQGSIDMDDRVRPYFDYIMAGYHFGSKPTRYLRGFSNHLRNYIPPLKPKEIDYNTRALIRAMENNQLFVLTHPGDKGMIDIGEVAEAAAKTGTLLEINTRHHYLTTEQLKQLKGMDIRYIVGSDAHRPEHVGVFDRAMDRIIASGMDISKIVNLERG